PKPRSRTPVVMGAVVVVAVLGAGGTWVTMQRRQAARTALAVADSTHRADSLRQDSIRVAAQRPPAPSPESTAVAMDTASRAGREPPAQSRRPVPRPTSPVATRPGPPPAPAPTSPAATGLIRLRTVPPDAQIFVDSRQVGVGSLFDFSVGAGPRQIRIVSPGCQPMEFSVTIEAGGTAQLRTRTLTCQ
ncbi:MAG: PEGA domain-containing protein, partial [Gemmatimonadales bacterium]|nr:PEGA domain-containing protein [Gemmatimonadales bacterium]